MITLAFHYVCWNLGNQKQVQSTQTSYRLLPTRTNPLRFPHPSQLHLSSLELELELDLALISSPKYPHLHYQLLSSYAYCFSFS